MSKPDKLYIVEHASELFSNHCDKVIINLRVFPHKHARNSKDDLAKIVTLYNKGEAAQYIDIRAVSH